MEKEGKSKEIEDIKRIISDTICYTEINSFTFDSAASLVIERLSEGGYILIHKDIVENVKAFLKPLEDWDNAWDDRWDENE